MRKFSELVIKRRGLISVIIILVTLFFAYRLKDIKVYTIFSDLLPKNHPNVELFKSHPNFGSPLTVYIMIKVKSGNVYNADILKKAWDMTRDLDLIPGVDHNQILSVASRSVKLFSATKEGITSMPIMGDKPPKSWEEIDVFKKNALGAPGVLGGFISPDGKALLITTTFIERLTDYGIVFKRINELINKYRDGSCEIYASGEPLIIGWVYHYERQVVWIILASLTAMFVILIINMKTVAGCFTPLIVSFISTIWGFGFITLFRYNLEPLILVIPMLIIARAFSHAVQTCERYYEVLSETGDKRESCIRSFRSIFPPGVLGIVTDAAGLFVIAITPIPVMQKMALFCGFWLCSLIPTDVILSAILISYLPTPRNVDKLVRREKSSLDRMIIVKVLDFAAGATSGRWATVTLVIAILVVSTAIFLSSRITVGTIHPGTPLLWPDSYYNVSARKTNESFVGMDTLQIVFEGIGSFGIGKSEAVHTISEFQRFMEIDPDVSATRSIMDYLLLFNRIAKGGHPRAEAIPDKDSYTSNMLKTTLLKSTPGDFDMILEPDTSAGSITVWYKDHRAITIERSIERAKTFIKTFISKVKDSSHNIRFKLATGSIGLQAAINETVSSSQGKILLMVNLMIFIMCAITYRSFVAGLLLLIPINVSNFIVGALMVIQKIGLDVNTLPVASVGMGIGIDYSIYITSRICEEYQKIGDYPWAIKEAIQTTGKAVFLTAFTLLIGVLPWYFMSNLRFQAEMGLFLGLIMLSNMVAALIIVPLTLYFIRPKFVSRIKYLVGK